MKIALVGTSNCVMVGGFAAGLDGDSRVSHFANYSIGVSSSVHLVKSTAGVDFSAFDFCIFDFSVNEDVMLRTEATTTLQIERNVAFLAARCLASGCLPVILIFPRTTPAELNLSREYYLDFAARFHLPYYDGYAFLEGLKAKSEKIPDGKYFMDSSHLVAPVALMMGTSVVSGLTKIQSRRLERESEPVSAYVLKEKSLTEYGLPPEAFFDRHNTRFADRFYSITDGQPLVLDVGDSAGDLIGICVNLSQTSCMLSMEGENTCGISLYNHFYRNPKNRLTISVLPLQEMVRPAGGKITFRPVMKLPASTRATLAPMKGVLGRPVADSEGPLLEISRLIFQTSEKIVIPGLPAAALHVDLLTEESWSEIDFDWYAKTIVATDDTGPAWLEFCSRTGIDSNFFLDRAFRLRERYYICKFTEPKVRCLEISRLGGFDASFFRLCNVLKLATLLDIHTIRVPENMIWRWEGLRGAGIELIQVANSKLSIPPGTIMGTFTHAYPFRQLMSAMKPEEFVEIIQTTLRPCVQENLSSRNDLDESDLVLQIRGGDEFEPSYVATAARPEWVPLTFVHPPHGYYQRCVEEHLKVFPQAEVILAIESRANPCVDSMEAWLRKMGIPYWIRSADVDSDLPLFLAARTIAWGPGTFGAAISLLSTKLRRCYWYDNQPSKEPSQKKNFHEFKVMGLGVTYLHNETGAYVKVGTWRNSPEQRQLMAEYATSNLVLKEPLKAATGQ